MTPKSRLVPLAVVSTVGLLLSPLQGASYTKAEVTRLHNDVKVLKENTTPRPAAVGDQITSVTSVATGAASRAELKFPDNSLTRLGANSRFTIRGDKRTLDLDQGVMLLQVPKQLGGAKVRTAAVTAAVTGTTVLFEYLPGGFVKLIVIEGVVDLYFNNNPGKFTHITAGQMIIMKTDSNTLPTPVDVDLSLLLKTSKLISGDDSSMPNFMEVVKAMEFQQKELQKGDLVATSFVLPGRGTLVELNNDTRLNVFKAFGIKDGDPSTTPPPTGGKGPDKDGPKPDGPGFEGFVPLITGTSFLGDSSYVETNPHVTVYNSDLEDSERFEGRVYNARTNAAGNDAFLPFPFFAFGSTSPVENANFQNFLTNTTSEEPSAESEMWAVFKFEELVVNGTPEFEFPIGTFDYEGPVEDPIRNVIFAAQNDILMGTEFAPGTEPPYLDGDESFDLRYNYDLEKVVFYSQNGGITVRDDFKVKGSYQDFAFVAAGLTSDVNLLGRVSTEGNVLISAGQDIVIANRLSANAVDAAAGRDLKVMEGGRVKASENVFLHAGRSINIADSTTLKLICANEDAVIQMLAKGGNINIGTETAEYYVGQTQISGPIVEIEAVNGNGLPGDINIFNSNINASNILRARTVGPDGWINIGNSTLSGTNALLLYAEGANGGIRFKTDTTLNGNNVHIAGRTVKVDQAATVYINSGNANVYADSDKRLYRVNGTGDSAHGNISVNSGSGTLNQQNFEARPAFRPTE